MRKVYLPLFYFLIFHLTFCIAQEGVFNIQTNEQVSQEFLSSILPDSFNLFDQDDPLLVTLESDFKKLRKQKNKVT